MWYPGSCVVLDCIDSSIPDFCRLSYFIFVFVLSYSMSTKVSCIDPYVFKYHILLENIVKNEREKTRNVGTTGKAENAQQAHNLKTTSYQRRCDVMTSHRRRYGVVLTSCVFWIFAYCPIIIRHRSISGLITSI